MYGLGLAQRLGVTMRHFITSFLYDRKPWEPRCRNSPGWTAALCGQGHRLPVHVPEQRRKITENYGNIPWAGASMRRSLTIRRCTALWDLAPGCAHAVMGRLISAGRTKRPA